MKEMYDMLEKEKQKLSKARQELFNDVNCTRKYHIISNEFVMKKCLLSGNCTNIPKEDASLIKAVKEFDEVFFNAEFSIFRDGVPYNSVVETMENKLENIRIAISKIDWQ